MKIGVYSGSFDPVTLGHQNAIERASKMFDKLIVVVSNNSEKKYWFTIEERKSMLKEVTGDCNNIEVDSHEGLLVDYLLKNNLNIIVKGIRNPEDCNLELFFADGNYTISNKKIDTIFLPSLKEYIHTSSTAVREVAKYGGKIDSYVNEKIVERVLERGKRYSPK